jgi:hypothetical protein
MTQLKTERKALKKLLKSGSKLAKKKPLPKDFSRQPSEKEIHMKAWQWVRNTYPDLLIFHVPSGEHRNVVTGIKLKRMGVVKGVADFLMFTSGCSIAIELKDRGGTQSPEQKHFQKQWEACGFVYKIARSLTDFQNIVNTHVWPWSLKQSASMTRQP